MKDACMGKEVINTSRKLKSLIREEEKLEAKIADMQIRLEEVRKAKKMEEDAEILKSFRSMELETWDLYNLATGIKDGEISMEILRQVMATGAEAKKAEESEAAAADPESPESLISEDDLNLTDAGEAPAGEESIDDEE